MHANSMKLMEKLFERFAPSGHGQRLYDIGSYDVNGSYRELATRFDWNYLGVDINPGPNVDVVVPPDGPWLVGERSSLVISGQCLEHTRRPWEWILNVRSLMAENALLFLIAPSSWPQHRYPVDCWRILPDGMMSLADYAGLTVIETNTSTAFEISTHHEDCYAVMTR